MLGKRQRFESILTLPKRTTTVDRYNNKNTNEITLQNTYDFINLDDYKPQLIHSPNRKSNSNSIVNSYQSVSSPSKVIISRDYLDKLRYCAKKSKINSSYNNIVQSKQQYNDAAQSYSDNTLLDAVKEQNTLLLHQIHLLRTQIDTNNDKTQLQEQEVLKLKLKLQNSISYDEHNKEIENYKKTVAVLQRSLQHIQMRSKETITQLHNELQLNRNNLKSLQKLSIPQLQQHEDEIQQIHTEYAGEIVSNQLKYQEIIINLIKQLLNDKYEYYNFLVCLQCTYIYISLI